MKLITLVDEQPVFDPEARAIKQFKAVIARDKDRQKRHALMELAFVHWYCSFDSRYDMYETEEERVEAIKTDVGLAEDWKVDSVISQALVKYADLMQTESMALVDKQREMISKLTTFIEEHEPTKMNKAGSFVFGPDKVQKLIMEMPKMIEALNQAKEIVQKELQDKHGGGNIRNRPLINGFDFENMGADNDSYQI